MEPYSACNFIVKEKDISGDGWKLSPKVYAYNSDPDNFTTPDTIENSEKVSTTWILVEKLQMKMMQNNRRYFT
ncbi:hypothetical protein [Acinetobacter nosocomialis]|uniref:hypothetical protein n=1 Tax=Acinetobacter nosocomialis TaxID=106654 RepID=UPI0024DE933F|nr:hypothetical protein [Acinetobacter nosocomialis]